VRNKGRYRQRRAGVILGSCFLAFSTAILAVGKFQLHLGTQALQTLSVVGIVFGSQATTYVIRGRGQLWGLRPSIWLVLSSVADVFNRDAANEKQPIWANQPSNVLLNCR
jgi:hypothetical protein